MRAKLFFCFNNNRIKGENYVPVKLERENCFFYFICLHGAL